MNLEVLSCAVGKGMPVYVPVNRVCLLVAAESYLPFVGRTA